MFQSMLRRVLGGFLKWWALDFLNGGHAASVMELDTGSDLSSENMRCKVKNRWLNFFNEAVLDLIHL